MYNDELRNEMNQNNITQLMAKIQHFNSKEELNTIIKSTADLYTKTAEKINPTPYPSPRRQRNPRKVNKRKWFDNECEILKRQLNQISKAVNRNPTDVNKRHQFYKIQKNYKKLLKQKRKQYEEELMKKLEILYHENRRILVTFKVSQTNVKEEGLPLTVENLMEHFKNLYSIKTFNKVVANQFVYHMENRKTFESLNNGISQQEVEKTMKKLKSKKAPGYDRITNEMLKCTNAHGIKLITALFNKILKLGIFPQEWNYGLIKLIHKGMDRYDATNYRGITSNSCLGKLFCTILYNRLDPLLEKENVYCKEQAGFRKDHRTTVMFLIPHKTSKVQHDINISYSLPTN